jgi:uncharacterized damage-inducible protein DinB
MEDDNTISYYFPGRRLPDAATSTRRTIMTRSAPVTMSEIDLWRHQTRMTRDVVGANVAGLTHEDSLVQPRPGGNCLNWVLGHLLSVYDGMLPLMRQEPVMGEEALTRYVRGAPPIRDRAEALNFEQMLSAWNQAVERIDAGLAGLSPDALDRPVESPTGNPNETVRSLLTTIVFHQAYHAGQTAVLRRIAGKEGAIR